MGDVPNFSFKRGFQPAVQAALAGALTMLAMAPAQARTDSVDIDIAASIKARCGFSAGMPASVDAPRDLEMAARLSVAVGLDCNTPYAIGVTSEHGALINTDATDDGSGYAFKKRYRISVALETDQGTVRSEPCNSATLVAGGECPFASTVSGKGLGSGRGISVGRNAVITVDWPSQATLPRRLAAGRYKDTLILVVGPRG